MKSHDGKEVIGWENIELISDRPLEVMLKEFKQLKAEFPDRVLIASIMEEYNKPAVSQPALALRCLPVLGARGEGAPSRRREPLGQHESLCLP